MLELLRKKHLMLVNVGKHDEARPGYFVSGIFFSAHNILPIRICFHFTTDMWFHQDSVV